MKKVWILAFVVLALSLFRPGMPAQAAETVTQSGSCSSTVSWKYYGSSRKLVVSGTGEIPWYGNGGCPWRNLQIKTVVVEEGITKIGGYAFLDHYSTMTKAYFPSTLQSIDIYVFNANFTCKTIVYNGTKAQWNALQKGTSYDRWDHWPGYGPSKITIQCTNGNVYQKDEIDYTIGDNVTWSYNASTDTVTFSGSGVISGSGSISADAWVRYINRDLRTVTGDRYHFKKIVFKSGITGVSGSVFSGVTADSYSIPSTFSYLAGENVTWSYNATTDTVTFSGTGKIGNWRSYDWLSMLNMLYQSSRDSGNYYHFKKIVIGNGITGFGSAFESVTADKVSLPSTLKTWYSGRAFFGSTPPQFTIASGANFTYDSEHKCVIQKDTKTLVQAWPGSVVPTDGSVKVIGSCAYNWFDYDERTTFTVPAGITKIEYGAFANWYSLKKLTILSPAVEIYDSASTITNTQSTEVILRGYSGSTAQAWAAKYGHGFEAISTSKPKITSQPAAATLYVGNSLTFKVKASGTGLTYRWQVSKDGGSTWKNVTSACTGYNKASLTPAAKATWNGYLYRCRVTDASGNKVYSQKVKLTIAPKITKQPAAATLYVGDALTFTVKATGAGLKYRWQVSKDGGTTWKNVTSACAGYSKASLTPAAKAAWNGYLYRCRITDANGSRVYSKKVLLTIGTKITKQPVSAAVSEGSKLPFTIKATGSGLKYRWQVSKDGGTTWKDVTTACTGYNTTSLKPVAKAAWNGYLYRCRITDANGKKTFSHGAMLTIQDNKIRETWGSMTFVLNPDTNVLTVSGTGKIPAWRGYASQIWYYNSDKIHVIKIKEGAAEINTYCFAYANKCTDLYLPSSLNSIGEGAFQYCSSLSVIHYSGTMSQWRAITKGTDWDSDTGSYRVVCTNGTIYK